MPWSRPAQRKDVFVAALLAASAVVVAQILFVASTASDVARQGSEEAAALKIEISTLREMVEANSTNVQLAVQSLRARGAWMRVISERVEVAAPEDDPLDLPCGDDE